MRSRRRFNITLSAGCHLLLLCCLFTTGLTAQSPQPAPVPPAATETGVPVALRPSEEVTITAEQQEKQGDVYRLRGNVVITMRSFTVRADEITYDSASGEVTARGHLSLDGGPHDEHVEASHGSFNTQTEGGRFYDVTGTAGIKVRGRSVLLTTSSPFFFSGKIVERIPPNRYVVHHGSITTCSMPKPKWKFSAEEIQVAVGEDAKIYHSTFRLLDVPIIYFPYVTHPINNLGRKTGFLIPSIGRSSQKGTIFGDSFYWTINPSMDMTVGAQYYSRRGWAQTADFRARPNERSSITMRFFGVTDRGIPTAAAPGASPTPTPFHQGGQEARLSADTRFGDGYRAVADIDYLSSFIFRQAFAESFTQAINSEVKSVAFATKSMGPYSLNLMTSRYQNFQNTAFLDTSSPIPPDFSQISGTNNIMILHAPSLEVSSIEHAIADSRFFASFDGAIEGVSRRAPGFKTASLLGRFDIHPAVSYAFYGKGWTLRPEISLRDTYYTQRLGFDSLVSDSEVNRRALESSFEFRPPALQRVFEKAIFGHKFKHTIEPRITYRYVNGVDNFRNIIRFDARDILSNTNEVEYAFTTRLYAKRTGKPADCALPSPDASERTRDEAEALKPKSSCGDTVSGSREVFSWDLAQKYYLDPKFGGNINIDQRNVFTSSADLTGIAFITDPRVVSPIVSRMRLQATNNMDVQWNLDYDTKKGRINASTALVNYRIGEYFMGASHAFLPPSVGVLPASTSLISLRYNQIQYMLGYGHPNKRGFTTAASLGFDITREFLQYTAAQISYNWDCCGISAEYRRFALGAVRNENQFRFAFTLANVGTFGTLRRQEQLY